MKEFMIESRLHSFGEDMVLLSCVTALLLATLASTVHAADNATPIIPTVSEHSPDCSRQRRASVVNVCLNIESLFRDEADSTKRQRQLAAWSAATTDEVVRSELTLALDRNANLVAYTQATNELHAEASRLYDIMHGPSSRTNRYSWGPPEEEPYRKTRQSIAALCEKHGVYREAAVARRSIPGPNTCVPNNYYTEMRFAAWRIRLHIEDQDRIFADMWHFLERSMESDFSGQTAEWLEPRIRDIYCCRAKLDNDLRKNMHRWSQCWNPESIRGVAPLKDLASRRLGTQEYSTLPQPGSRPRPPSPSAVAAVSNAVYHGSHTDLEELLKSYHWYDIQTSLASLPAEFPCLFAKTPEPLPFHQTIKANMFVLSAALIAAPDPLLFFEVGTVIPNTSPDMNPKQHRWSHDWYEAKCVGGRWNQPISVVTDAPAINDLSLCKSEDGTIVWAAILRRDPSAPKWGPMGDENESLVVGTRGWVGLPGRARAVVDYLQSMVFGTTGWGSQWSVSFSTKASSASRLVLDDKGQTHIAWSSFSPKTRMSTLHYWTSGDTLGAYRDIPQPTGMPAASWIPPLIAVNAGLVELFTYGTGNQLEHPSWMYAVRTVKGWQTEPLMEDTTRNSQTGLKGEEILFRPDDFGGFPEGNGVFITRGSSSRPFLSTTLRYPHDLARFSSVPHNSMDQGLALRSNNGRNLGIGARGLDSLIYLFRTTGSTTEVLPIYASRTNANVSPVDVVVDGDMIRMVWLEKGKRHLLFCDSFPFPRQGWNKGVTPLWRLCAGRGAVGTMTLLLATDLKRKAERMEQEGRYDEAIRLYVLLTENTVEPDTPSFNRLIAMDEAGITGVRRELSRHHGSQVQPSFTSPALDTIGRVPDTDEMEQYLDLPVQDSNTVRRLLEAYKSSKDDPNRR
jgi:hypothetical protein